MVVVVGGEGVARTYTLRVRVSSARPPTARVNDGRARTARHSLEELTTTTESTSLERRGALRENVPFFSLSSRRYFIC